MTGARALGLLALAIAGRAEAEGAATTTATHAAASVASASAPITTATIARATTATVTVLATTATVAEPPGGRPWSAGAPRAFIASMVDAGYLYLRPRVMLGYGQPHAAWVGAELNPIFSGAGVGGYAGVRAAYGGFDVRVGARAFYAFERTYLPPAPSYERVDLATTDGGHAVYGTLETELNGAITLGPGELLGLGSLSYVVGVPEGQRVYEETLRVVVAPPWVWRARGGYAWMPIAGARHSVAAMVDVLGVPERGIVTVRAGLVVRVVLSRALELRGSFVPKLSGIDDIGILGGDFAELGLRWRWASGEP